MIMKEQDKKQEQLSRAIDALNSDRSYPSDCETAELIQVAQLVKRSGAADKASSQMMADTVERLASELGARSRKRRRSWVFSGVAGVIAAAWMLVTLNAGLFMTEEPGRTYTQNSGDLANIVQIQREQADPITSLPPTNPATAEKQPIAGADRTVDRAAEPSKAKRETPAAPVQDQKPATDIKVAVNDQSTAADKAAKAQTEKMLSLAGRTARSKMVDASTGEIRQAYTTEAGEITLVQGSKARSAGEAETAAPKAAVTMRSSGIAAGKEADKEADKKPSTEKTAEKRASKINKVTVTVDGVEATLEGEQSEEELKKIASTVVKE